MVQDHLDEVWRAALAASGEQDVAEELTTAVLCAAPPDAAAADLVRLLTTGLRSTVHRRAACRDAAGTAP